MVRPMMIVMGRYGLLAVRGIELKTRRKADRMEGGFILIPSSLCARILSPSHKRHVSRTSILGA